MHVSPDNQFMRGPDDFVRTLRSGRRHHYTSWEPQGLEVELSLRASDSSTSYWTLIYENKALRKSFEAAKRAREKGVL